MIDFRSLSQQDSHHGHVSVCGGQMQTGASPFVGQVQQRSRAAEQQSDHSRVSTLSCQVERTGALKHMRVGQSLLRSNITLQTADTLLISCLNVCFCISLNARRIQQQSNHVLMTGLSRQVQGSVT